MSRPDFRYFLDRVVSQGFAGQVTAFINGPVLIENDKRGTAIHGHTGEWPDRFAISVAVKDKRKAINKAFSKCDEWGVPFVLEALTGELVTGDSGETYTLYPAKMLKLKEPTP